MTQESEGWHDLAIRGGHVIDGTGHARFVADVLVTSGRISGVVAPGAGRSKDTLDASGRIVCPGFIDTHSHDDRYVLEANSPHAKLSQGVCTVVTGNCGISLAPWVSDNPPPPLDLLGDSAYHFSSFSDYLTALDAVALQVNVVPLIGHTTLRVGRVQNIQKEATALEAKAMYQDVAHAMDAGAFGLSTGVYYPPAFAATPSELKVVGSALQGRCAVLACHIRDEGDQIDAALREAFDVARHCDSTLVLSHHKVVGSMNKGRSRETLRAIERAAESMDVCFDCYPYDASSTMLSPAKAATTRDVLITWSLPYPDLSGKRLAAIAADWRVDAEEAARRLMPGGAIYFSMAEEDVQRILAHPLAMIGSDGLAHDARPHPRFWGTFPRVLGHYSRDLRIFSLEMAVHKMTGLPARRFGLHDRGSIREGLAADIVIFDPRLINDCATYEKSTESSVGLDAVLVNGSLACWRGTVTRTSSGKRLRPSQK